MRFSKSGVAVLLAVLLCAALAAPAAAVERPTAVITDHGSDEAGPEAGFPEKVADAMFESSGEPFSVEEYFRVQTFGAVGFSGDRGDVMARTNWPPLKPTAPGPHVEQRS